MANYKLAPICCKKCASDDVIKCGHIRGKQRFRCKKCGYNFVIGDERTTEQIALKKAVLLILHIMAGATFRELGRLFNLCSSQVYRWIVRRGFQYPIQDMHGKIDTIKADDIEGFMQRNINRFDKSKPIVVGTGELMPGYRMIMLIQTPTGDKVKEKEQPSIQYRSLPYATR